MEMAAHDLPPHFGACCPGRLGNNPAYVSFLPNALYSAPGIAVNASLWAMNRAQWASAMLAAMGVSAWWRPLAIAAVACPVRFVHPRCAAASMIELAAAARGGWTTANRKLFMKESTHSPRRLGLGTPFWLRSGIGGATGESSGVGSA